MLANQQVISKKGIPMMPLLDQGSNSANLNQWLEKARTVLRVSNADYLSSKMFNQVDDKQRVDDKMAKFFAIQAKKTPNKVKDEKSEDEDKGEGGYEPKYTIPVHIGVSDVGLPYFMDYSFDPPKVEGAEEQAKRWALWTVLVSSLPHHEHLVKSGVEGDIHGLLERVGNVAEGRDERQVKSLVRKLVSLKMGGSWDEFSLGVIKIRQDMGAIGRREPSLGMGEGLFVSFVVDAIQQDPAYKTTIELLRKEAKAYGHPFGYKELMEACTATANTLRVGPGIKANVAAAGAGAGAAGKGAHGSKLCWNWRDRGSCRFGDKCKFLHEEGGAGPKRGKCPNCGGGHGLQDCPTAKLRAQLAEAQKKIESLTTMATGDPVGVATEEEPEPAAEMATLHNPAAEVRRMWGGL